MNLTDALGPAYIRVSGSWAASTYFDPDGEPGEEAPEGFNAVLTGDQWRGVGDFADAVDGQIVTSYALSAGTFDEDGTWLPDEAMKRMIFSRDNDIPVIAAELFNEPSLRIGFPHGYDAAAYNRDFAVFADAARSEVPDMKLVGPSATNDVDTSIIEARLPADEMFEGTGADLDVVSYHFYPKVSERCGAEGDPTLGLDAAYLDAVDETRDYYTDLRDTYAGGVPMWVTETAQAACGGDRWSSTYVDVIRLVDTFGKLTNGDGNAVFHNTLVGSDYAYLAEDGFEPRPTYWAAVLWHRLMGPTVLAPEASGETDVRVHAQCTPGDAKGATYAVINTSAEDARTVAAASGEATLHQLTGEALDASTVQLNGTELHDDGDGGLPGMDGESATGVVTLPPASVTFMVDDTPVAACT